MQLNLVPMLALVLLNVLVVVYVLARRGTSRASLFLLLNGLSLILWAVGQSLYDRSAESERWLLAMPYVAALIVPANLLYFALVQPFPLRGPWRKNTIAIVVFGPCIVLPLFEDYSLQTALLFNYSYRGSDLLLQGIITRGAALYCALALLAALAVLAVRYAASVGPDQSTYKHLIASIIGPLLFGGFFWAASRSGGPYVTPSPSLLFALMAQIGLVVMLRQEDVRNPRLLSRVAFYACAILAAFVMVSLMVQFYDYIAGAIVLESMTGWLLLGSTLLMILLARLSHAERAFDRLLFSRASEYRRIVRETREELRDARERIRKAERLSVVGELAARMAHEIKNPLGPIKGYTQMMRERLGGTEPFIHREAFLRHLDIIAEEVETIDRRLRQFLQTARPPDIVLEPTSVNSLLERCSRLMRLEAAALGLGGELEPVRVETDLHRDLPTIQGDAERLEEAFFNVARNALDAAVTNQWGSVRMRTRSQVGDVGQRGVLVSIEDTGPGFPSVGRELLFEPFRTSKKEGTGLGLAIARSAIEAHGGTITLGDREGGGASVKIWLPVLASPNPGALLPRV